MSEPTETVEEPKPRFTEVRQFAAGDRFIGFTTCLECGAGIFIDPEDRKNDIHPMAIHIGWHDDLGETLDEIEVFTEKATEALKRIVVSNKAEFTKEVTDSGRQIQRTTPDASDDRRSDVEAPVPAADDVQERRQVGTNRPQGPRPGPVPGVPREGRGQGPVVGPSGGSGQAKASN